jgi:hypothetical protein
MGNSDIHVNDGSHRRAHVAKVNSGVHMAYFGVQFRMARAATRLGVRDVCAGARMSPRTLGLIEVADEIEYGVKQEGRFEKATVAKLVTFYRGCGVTFVTVDPPTQCRGPGVHYKRARGV